MWKLYFCCLFFGGLASAQVPKLQITEISSQTIGSTKEWFEFSLSGTSAINIANWKISNGGTVKSFWDNVKLLRPESLFDLETFSGSGYSGTGFSGSGFSGSGKSVFQFSDALIFLPPKKERAWFFWEKSPVSLNNNGGSLSILNENNEILDQVVFPKLKTGTFEGSKYGEIWNIDENKNEFPLIFRNNNDVNFQHSRGRENFSAPVKPEEINILINEVSPNRDLPNAKIDFIELFIASTKEKIANLKYCEIKHNGTPLFFFEKNFWVKTGDFIVLELNGLPPMISKNSNPFIISTNKKNNISAGSGTVEVILFSGTSLEETEDFLCWKNGNLNTTEQARVNKNQGKNWNGECIDISDLIKNESIARAEDPSDSNSKFDFHRHYNGSFGVHNVVENSPPVAKITTQGAKRIYKTTLNFTGEDSTDPDGLSDLKSFEWKKNGKFFSNEINPKSIAFDSLGKYEISLTVKDQSDFENTVFETIEVVTNEEGEQIIDVFNLGGNSSSSFKKKQIKSWLTQKLSEKTNPKNILNSKSISEKQIITTNFFENFIKTIPDDFLEKLNAISFIQNSPSSFFPKNSIVKDLEPLKINIHKKKCRKKIKSLNELFD
jgi:hypothetical protein